MNLLSFDLSYITSNLFCISEISFLIWFFLCLYFCIQIQVNGKCVINVKENDQREHTTVADVNSVYWEWTIIVPGKRKLFPLFKKMFCFHMRFCFNHLFFMLTLLNSDAVILQLRWILIGSFLCVLFRINNCVGEENHYAFMQLLFWAFCLSWMAFWSLMLHYWYYPACVTCDKVSMLFSLLYELDKCDVCIC